jgi:hypothetical protein
MLVPVSNGLPVLVSFFFLGGWGDVLIMMFLSLEECRLLVIQPLSRSAARPLGHLSCWSVGSPFGQLATCPVCWSVARPDGQSVAHTVGQSVGHPFGLVGRPSGWPPVRLAAHPVGPLSGWWVGHPSGQSAARPVGRLPVQLISCPDSQSASRPFGRCATIVIAIRS